MTETPNLGLSQWELTDLIQMDDFNSDNLKIDTRVGNIANRNLLDNWYFANPVDQRGGYITTIDTPAYSDEGLTNLLGTVGGLAKVTPITINKVLFELTI